jgi:hypothetical protein
MSRPKLPFAAFWQGIFHARAQTLIAGTKKGQFALVILLVGFRQEA